MLLTMLVNEYIRYMEGIRRYSPRTVTVYSEILEKFTSFAGARDDGTLLESLTPQILRSYEVMLMDSEKLDPRTVNLPLSGPSGKPGVEPSAPGSPSQGAQASSGVLPQRIDE